MNNKACEIKRVKSVKKIEIKLHKFPKTKSTKKFRSMKLKLRCEKARNEEFKCPKK